MKLLSKEIYEVLELKFGYQGMGTSGYNEDVTHRFYSFEKNNISYNVVYYEQRNGSATYYIEKDGVTVDDINEAKEIFVIANAIE